MKTFKSLLVILTVLVAGQAVTAISEARRQQAAALKQNAQAEKARILVAVLKPFGDDFDSLSVKAKYTSAFSVINDEIARAKKNIEQHLKAKADFNKSYETNETVRHEYLYGQKEKPVFDVPALEGVLTFALTIKKQLERSKQDRLETPSLPISDEIAEIIEA